MGRLIDADKLSQDCMYNKNGTRGFAISQSQIVNAPTVDAIPRKTVFDFKVKLDKWMFHNHESVCGQRMIDIDYLDGEIWELFQELGIVRYDDDGNLIDEVSKE